MGSLALESVPDSGKRRRPRAHVGRDTSASGLLSTASGRPAREEAGEYSALRLELLPHSNCVMRS